MCDSFDEGYGSDGRRSPVNIDEKRIQNDCRIFKEKYRIDKLLSNSANGIIYSGVRKSDGVKCVAKQVPRGKIGAFIEQENGRQIPLEFHLHLKATSDGVPGIAEAWECFERHTSWVLIMERPKHSTDLFEVLAELGTLQEQAAAIVLSQIVETCIYLEQAGIFHRDIKDENILLDVTTLKTKLIDFGCGDFHTNKNYEKFSGTIQFAPPEVHLGPYRGSPVTVWSIGALAYTLLVGDVPYETRDDVISGNCKKQNWRDNLSVQAADFISGCMKSNPSQRPRLADLQNHALLQTL